MVYPCARCLETREAALELALRVGGGVLPERFDDVVFDALRKRAALQPVPIKDPGNVAVRCALGG